jgi:ketosteroid isomerase-like protein
MDAGDVEGLLALVTTDHMKIEPNAPVITGKEAYRSSRQAVFEQYSFEDSDCVAVEVRLADDWACARGTWSTKIVPTNGDEPFQDSGNWIDIFDRQPDGSWKSSRSIYVSEVPLREGTE